MNLPITFDTQVVRDIVKGIGKSNTYEKTVRKMIKLKLLRRLVEHFRRNKHYMMADMCVLSYWFMLRVPSECLGMQRNGDHSRFEIALNNAVTLHLNKRKNSPWGSSLTRTCCCPRLGQFLCPHGVLAKYVPLRTGSQRLFTITYSYFLILLRRALFELRVPDARKFGSHSFRRGCADDMRESKAPLRDILEAGGWRSGAFMLYMSREEVEKDAVAQIAIDFSSDEED